MALSQCAIFAIIDDICRRNSN
ncbi:hypothetical protein SPHINGO391_440029 [Sphingomonas aurantiaca]|uniref:Uncharacterized protein n=1 Tax=Sphingomonas aurantiaca TaxID=185949 RepID=A0A5E7Z1X8_9SPHN|nr:hypothetical protein SPHINGO391_440029 [Sphingomonas aurantiaca]